MTEFFAQGIGIWGITPGPDGDLWFILGTDQIGQSTPSGNVTLYPTGAHGAQPQSIVMGPDGNLWFTEFNANKIGRLIP
ncbi:MAG: hypothetical protein JO135_06575 [Candidatus Eremiobacteraeota bacterium]|nr:hypothetical protein [Candidatus Eremiobacteraeota bacterium]